MEFKPTKLDIHVYDYKLRAIEEFGIIVRWCRLYPTAVERVLEVVTNGGKIRCIFPFECKRFPCDTLYCNADTCDNGHAYRMS